MADVDLVQAELRELASTLVDATGDPTETFGVYFLDPDADAAALPRHVEHVVFDEWFGNSPELLAAEYGPYEASTIFITVIDHRRRLPAGMGRVILPSELGFKTLHDIEARWGEPLGGVLERTGRDWDITRIWDFATIAVMPEYRGKATDGLIMLSMLQTGSQGLIMTGGRFMICVLDVNVWQYFNATMYDAFEPYPDVAPIEYLDSPASIPTFVDFDRYGPYLLEQDQPTHQMLLEDAGIAPVVRAPEWAPLLRRTGTPALPPVGGRATSTQAL
ncbi:MAG: hypothetical protein ACXVK4_04100 [Acidimicrobiia bacterium]